MKQRFNVYALVTALMALVFISTSYSATAAQTRSVEKPAPVQSYAPHTQLRRGYKVVVKPALPAITNNWAGYGILPSSANESFTNVAGSWIQPSMTCNNKTDSEYAPQWVGLDGYASSTVEQSGVTASCKKGVIAYQAFTEAYPNQAIYDSTTTYPVTPGDVMSAATTYAGVKGADSDFTLVISDVTAGWKKTVNGSLPTSDGPFGTSAEWITEDLGNYLPNFNSVTFTNATAKDNNGLAGGISVFNYQTTAITDSNNLTLVGPSALGNDGSSFTNTWYAAD